VFKYFLLTILKLSFWRIFAFLTLTSVITCHEWSEAKPQMYRRDLWANTTEKKRKAKSLCIHPHLPLAKHKAWQTRGDTPSSSKSLILSPALFYARKTPHFSRCFANVTWEGNLMRQPVEGQELFAHCAVPVFPRFRPTQLLRGSPGRTTFDLTRAEMGCAMEPVQVAWY